MITRRIGSLIRGKATPFQIIAACLLGAALGFMPGFVQAPGLILVLTFLLIVLNANLALAALVGVGAKLLSLALAPVSFSLGRCLLDGPTSGLLQKLINAPVFAWFGFDYYLTTGGLAMGLVVGAVVGFALAATITRYRRKMASLEQNSERFQKWTSKKSVRFLTWLLVGGNKGKKSYEELLAKRIGNPIRVLGVVFVALVVGVGYLAQQFAAEPVLTSVLKSGLEGANGATVDVGAVKLDLKANRLRIENLALADPKALDTDLFRAAAIEADISAKNLLRKRLQLDRVEVSGARSGAKRDVPGELVGPPPEPAPAPPPEGDSKTLDDYLKQAKIWKERLAQAKRWLEKISGPEEETEAGPEPTPEEKKETLRERLEREVREKGYAGVRATHLIEGAPTFTILELAARDVKVEGLPDETLEVEAHNLSTHPALLGKTPSLQVKSAQDSLSFELAVASLENRAATNILKFAWKGLPTDKIAGDLAISGTRPLQGGTIDLSADGSWTTAGGVSVNLPLQAALHDVQFTLPTGDQTKLDNFVLPIAVSGPLDNPRIKVDDSGLGKAALAAGKAKAVDEAKKQAGKLLDENVGGALGEQGKGLLNNILGGKKK